MSTFIEMPDWFKLPMMQMKTVNIKNLEKINTAIILFDLITYSIRHF